MKCPKCNGYGYYEKEEDGVIELIKCECQMTNEEWLRTCSTEELAEFIRKQRDDWSDGWYSDWHPFSEIVEWLKEEHNA